MGGILCKCLCKCFTGGEEEPSQALYPAATEPFVPVYEDEDELFRAATEPFVPVYEDEDEDEDQLLPDFSSPPPWIITPKREPLNCNTLDYIPLLELQQVLSNNSQLQPFIIDYIKISTDTNQFFSSIKECLQEVKSSADLLLRAVKFFENYDVPASIAIETLKEFKTHGEIFPHIVNKFRSSSMDHLSRVQTLSKLQKNLYQNLGTVETWKAVGLIVSNVTIFGLTISSVVLALVGNSKLGEEVLRQGGEAIRKLEFTSTRLLDKCQTSLEGKRDNIGALLAQGKKELCNIRKLRSVTSIATKQLGIIKRRVHEQVEDCIKMVEGNIGLQMQELKKMMTTVIYDIKAEAVCLNSCVEELSKEVVRCREDLKTVEATIWKVVKNMKK